MKNDKDDELLKLKVSVCEECNRACCWHGQFMCDVSDYCGTTDVELGELIKMRREHHDYWIDDLSYKLDEPKLSEVKKYLDEIMERKS